MTSFFKAEKYRDLIAFCIDERKISGNFKQSHAAEAAGVQAAYFSNVLKNRAELNDDQLFALCDFHSERIF